MKKLIIIGAGGHGKVVADAAQKMEMWDSIEFVDLRYPELKLCGPWPIIGKHLTDLEYPTDSLNFLVAIGDNALRLKLHKEALNCGFEAAKIIHPRASVSEFAEVGKGVVIFANAVVNINASISDCAIINTAATVDHDCKISEAVHLSPGVNLAGEVSVGKETWVGIGASVIQQIKIAENVIVGAGAVVISDIPKNTTVVGLPARPL